MHKNISQLSKKIIGCLPYSNIFLFVDEISSISEDKIIGHYRFSENDFFYKAHFTHLPVTPGVILIEMMGQIGMVCHLVYINEIYKIGKKFHPILSNVETSFLKQVNVNEKLTVISEKVYYRRGILKSNLQLLNSKGETCVLCKALLHLVYD